ncbi:ABC transporter substrate-binding protein [Solirubrobacter ginsenosidimutans]|uniref:ABC transporter substrate-binding protein n=1 Tax=Solirubrobacter ginsenosidimutans TaxID=490573 RepID=A0A9X3MMB6_9ACTN|nr:ABC transporter substrate-binding protein [Solirubrobacter ginsenosidimutans]MDA0159064.1 ABC transporter substrate-binding protein [Solirubrobacter ginsenosidimutans]
MKTTGNWMACFAAVAAAGAVLAGCGGDDSSSSASKGDSSAPAATATPAAAALGSENKASGTPITVGLLNLESGPVAFPEYSAAAKAAVSYINDYKGGIGGHPVQLELCATDGQPATSARCAGQVVDKKPAFILGGADIGGPGSFPIYEKAKLAYLGGVPFTPVESNAPNSVEFISISIGDNLAAAKYAVDQFHPKKAVVLYTDNTQGKAIGVGVITPSLKSQGVDTKPIPVPESTGDLSSVAASAIQAQPDLIYVNTPNACPQILKALKAVGNTAKLAGIELCTAPPALKAAGDAAEGIFVADPFDSLDAGTDDTNLFLAAMQKYGGKAVVLDSLAQAAFSSVMNVQERLNDVKDLNTDAILGAFKDGQSHPNFMAHEYTCDGKQLPANAAICNAYQRIKTVKDGKVIPATDEWVSGASNYQPATH